MRAGSERWLRRGLLFDDGLWQRLKARAEVEKSTVSTLVRDMLLGAIEAREVGAGSVGPSKADRLLEAAEHIVMELRNLAALVGSVGRSAIGSQYLLVHWAAREEALGVSEDELDAELQAVAAEGWAQILDELRESKEIDLRTPPEKGGSEDSR
jgi:hypothetical protein